MSALGYHLPPGCTDAQLEARFAEPCGECEAQAFRGAIAGEVEDVLDEMVPQVRRGGEAVKPDANANGNPVRGNASVLSAAPPSASRGCSRASTGSADERGDVHPRFADLVIAAPELYALVAERIDSLCDCEGPNEANDFKGERCPAHAAIAKAEGRA
jgi:hypothetical protein